MGKPTVHDIAHAAGVSLATVDRVLNGRPGVRSATARRVQDAVDRLGYVRDLYAANLARQRLYRFAFVLPDGSSEFLKSLRDAIAEASRGMRADRAEFRVDHVALNDPAGMIRTLGALIEAGVDGVAIMAEETPVVRDMISRLRAAGISVVALVTDQPNSERDHFVGIDNVAAGRTAGVLMGRFCGARTGEIMVVVNSTHARDMVQRRFGFDEVLQRDFPHLSALPSIEGHDDDELAAKVAARCLAHHPDIVGVYSVGAGTRGVTEALAVRPRTGPHVVIGHELTAWSRQALQDGRLDLVITQNPGHLVRSAARILRARSDGIDIIASQERLRIEIVIRENLH